MDSLKDLTIKVTYTVGLENVEMPDIVKKQLKEISGDLDGIDGLSSNNYPEADAWLKENIIERDCYRLKYEVEDIS